MPRRAICASTIRSRALEGLSMTTPELPEDAVADGSMLLRADSCVAPQRKTELPVRPRVKCEQVKNEKSAHAGEKQPSERRKSKDPSRSSIQHGKGSGRVGLRRRPYDRGSGLLPQNPLRAST